jgi:hypothetical protein
MNTGTVHLAAENSYVLLLDDEFNGSHLGGKLILKTPIVFWKCDCNGNEPPTPYGPKTGEWGPMSNRLFGGQSTQLVPLAFDAILTSSGKVIDADGARFTEFSSVDHWLDRVWCNRHELQLDVVEATGTSGPHAATAHDKEIPF